MAECELKALLVATQALIDETRTDQRFSAADIRRMHAALAGRDLRVGGALSDGESREG
jgi:hypothetical protein